MKKKLIILSHDAMVREDVDYLQQTEPFRTLTADGAQVTHLRTIYPTVTYPAHTSIITGTYPEKHGVVSNEITAVGRMGSPWRWFRDANHMPSLFTAAKAAGLSTASVYWPVTGNDPDIDYLVNEYWAQGPDDTLEAALRRSGTSDDVFTRAVAPHMELTHGEGKPRHPYCDQFVIDIACSMIEEFRPDVLAIHPANVDNARHGNGLFNDAVIASLDNVARWTQQIIDATKRAGVFEQTDLVVLSDHGQLDVTRVCNPNVALAEHGLIRTDEDGNYLDSDAFCQSNAMSSYVYLKNPSNIALVDRVGDLLEEMRASGEYGISRVFSREEAAEEEHLYGGFSFVLETDGTTTFGNSWNRPICTSLIREDYRSGRATHGYHPDKGPQPVFIGYGPSFRKGAVLERRPIVDCAPTFAKLLGLEMPWAQGTAMTELLN